MELTLLSGLSWRCNAPTAFQVGHSILSLILPHTKCSEVTWGFLLDEMKYLTELAVRDYYISTQRTSTVALGAIFNAISDTNTKERQELLEAFLRVTMECFDFDHSIQIAAASKRLHWLLQRESNYDDCNSLPSQMIPYPQSKKTICGGRSFGETFKHSSSQKSDLEGRHVLNEIDELGQEHPVSCHLYKISLANCCSPFTSDAVCTVGMFQCRM